MSDQQSQPVFQIEKLYVKDISLEMPNAPQIFLVREQPEIEMQLHTNAQALDDGYHHCVLTVTVTASLGDKTYFLVEVSQAGIFLIKNVPDSDMGPILGIACPNILFPYAREVVSDVVTRAGFPPVVLAPINFEALYAQRQAQESDAQPATATLQ